MLPTTATLTGIWGPEDEVGGGFAGTIVKDEAYLASVSFELPLTSAPEFVFVPGTASGYGANAGAGCPGVDEGGLPKADSGKFCVYSAVDYGFATDPTVEVANPDILGSGTTRAGALLKVTCNATEGSCIGAGLWAVHGN